MTLSTHSTWQLRLCLPDGTWTDLPLYGDESAGRLSADKASIQFDIPPGRHLYLATKTSANFAVPPECTAFPLEPRTRYKLRGTCELEGGAVSLWLIEYGPEGRLGHENRSLKNGAFEFEWTTKSRHRSCCLAVRLSGRGRLRFASLELIDLEDVHGPQTGPRGRFRSPSIFYDPAGYKPYVEVHHRFYDEPRRDWYARAAEPFKGCTSVLDIGCGPGFLLEALHAIGVTRAMGLERDPVYLQQCVQRGLNVVEHDLNEPFPFLESRAFDGVVSHSSFDYLAPIAARGVLRECRRVLKPGGLLRIEARNDGQSSGDEARCSVPLTADRLRRMLREAGFDAIEVETEQRVVRASARRPSDAANWPTRSVILGCGRRVKPWAKRRVILTPDADAWDNVSTRDFTILTAPDKAEHRVEGLLVGYYTGYRREGEHVVRGVCRCVSADGLTWCRDPAGPVLAAGQPGDWDAGGVAIGSVIALDEPPGGYIMYYSARGLDGCWPGIGIARSPDGIGWQKELQPVLRGVDFGGLKHLALADVLRTSSGRWLMHCEGWVDGRGWAVFQASSPDGLTWRPTQAEPVLDPQDVPWGAQHVANPKCVEIEAGQFVLGFNAADADGAFQLALAESTDARRWRIPIVNPVVCTTTNDFRIESFFMTRDAWQRGDQRIYFFSSATYDTHLSSRVLSAEADFEADWVGPPWETRRPGLYRVRADRLHAEPGASVEAEALGRRVVLDRETQCTLRLAPTSGGRGGVVLALEGEGRVQTLRILGDGTVARDAETLLDATTGPVATAVCLRILKPPGRPAELVLGVWRDTQRCLALHEVLEFMPGTLSLRIEVPPGEPALMVDHVDVWQPEPVLVEGFGDAHMYMGVCRSSDELLPDIDEESFLHVLDRNGIGRALVATYGATPQLDSFDQIVRLIPRRRGRIWPLLRVPAWPEAGPAERRFQVNQLEVLWQKGLLAGLKVKLNAPEVPVPEVLAWVQRRQVLTMWHVSSPADLAWLEKEVLERYTFPVLLSHFGGYPLDCRRYRSCIDLLDRYKNLYLVTSVVFFRKYLEEAVRRHPDRILLGSDFPGVEPAVARSAILRLGVPRADKIRVISENLRFLTERVAWHRWETLRKGTDLLFPRLPETPAEVEAQGFEVIPPERMPAEEPRAAQAFWSGFEVSSFYLEHKPWATLVANLARALGARSVLEFGCHVGRNLVAVREAIPEARLVGIDINEQAVRVGRERNGLDLRVGDQSALAEFADGEFDLVYTVSVLDHIPSIADVCRELVRIAARNVFFLEVTLPVEGKVLRHYDHKRGCVFPSTEASYSWFVDRYLEGCPRLWRMDKRPCYLHASRLGPYYWAYLGFLDPPGEKPG